MQTVLNNTGTCYTKWEKLEKWTQSVIYNIHCVFNIKNKSMLRVVIPR